MKKILLSLALASFALVSARADLIWYEGFNYADGAITNVAAGIWEHHSGNVADALVSNKRLQVANFRSEDVNRKFPAAFTTSPTNLYGSFMVNCTNAPSITNYFAHFYVNTSTFHGRAFSAPGSLPNTWRLGVTTASSVINLVKFLTIDLATNTDYQVVINWDASVGINAIASMWVNPISSADTSAVAGDTVTPAPAASLGFGFRQASGGVNSMVNITNLAIGTTFAEAATNVWATNAVAPVMVYSPQSGTNFVGTPFPVLLSGVAAGQGLANFTYLWLKDGALYTNPNGNTNTLVTSSAAASDSGAYQLVATTPYGLSVTSAVANLWVTNALIPPTITAQPTNTTVFYGQTATLSVSVFGPGTITYQWNHAGTNLPGQNGPVLTIPNVQTNNGTTGTYNVGITNEYGGVLSSNAVVSATPIPTVSIAYLRTLVDANYLATNSTLVYQATGTVTTFTNITSGNTSSYYLQDGTAGINIFATLASGFRPNQGDVVTFVGVLSSFNSTLELLADSANNPASSYTVIGSNAPLPAPKVIPFNITNDLAFCENKLEGSIVMLTNVFFGTNAGNVISTSANTTVTVTNRAGETFNVTFSSQDLDTAGKTLPAFAWSVVGAFVQNLGNGVSPRNQGYAVQVTRFSDIVTDAPPAPQLGVDPLIAWQLPAWDNVNYSYGSNYSYTVLGAQPGYRAALSGAGEFPANASTATGTGRVVVSPDGSTITVNMSFSGLTGGNASAAHIHGPAGPGTNASVLFPFTGVPAATSGSIPEQSFALSPAQASNLYNGLLYMNVHNATFPGGEIRDQLRVAPPAVTGPYVPVSSFKAALIGVNEVPANISTATGSGTVVLSPDQTTITVNFSFSGLTGGPATAAHIHGPAGAGTNASVLFTFAGVPAATSGSITQQSFAITPAQVTNLQTGQLYMNVHNATYPGGEIRDQLRLVSSVGLTFANSSLTNTTPIKATFTDPTASSSSQKFYRVTSP